MINYKEIELYLKHGLYVSVRDTNENYQIISPVKDADGYYRTSTFWCTLGFAKQHIGSYHGNYNLEEVCKDWTEITPFHLDFEPYPVGMKVKVIKTGYIEEISRSYSGRYELKGNFGTFPYHELIPVFEEEPTITLTDEELLTECERRGVSTKITK